MARDDLRAQGERDLAERLLKEPEVRQAIERIERSADDFNARRHLLGSAMRLAPEMAPDVDGMLQACRTTLGIELPLETYVYPSPDFNAAAVRPERGMMFVLVSSSLLEAFEPDELRFVLGHELGHQMFEHHRIPVGALLGGGSTVDARLALPLFAWQRYAEISADRAGLVCAGGLDGAARALFKLASGLRGGRVRILIDKFLSQVGDLREEAAREAHTDAPMRRDWFASHPFSPLRLRAAELTVNSEIMRPGGTPRAALEAEIHELMTLMDPNYLQERSEVAEAMRRLLFSGSVLIATASGKVDEKALEALGKLLGPGAAPRTVDPAPVREHLPERIARANDVVPLLRRAQVIRDLCTVARADNHTSAAEMQVIYDLAKALGVDHSLVQCSVEAATDLD